MTGYQRAVLWIGLIIIALNLFTGANAAALKAIIFTPSSKLASPPQNTVPVPTNPVTQPPIATT